MAPRRLNGEDDDEGSDPPPSFALPPIEGEPDPDGSDCVACGRCCHHEPNTVHFFRDDEDRMSEEQLDRFTILQRKPPGFRFMKNERGHCGALDVSVPGHYPCQLYAVRPEGCRVVEPGSPCCLEARRLGRLGTSVEFKRPPRK